MKAPAPLTCGKLTIELGAELLCLAGRMRRPGPDGRAQIAATLDNGKALEKFHEMVAAQGGDLAAERPLAEATEIVADRSGCVARIDAEALGWAVIEMGGGRKKIGDAIDYGVGLEMLVRIGDQVTAGQPLVTLFARPPQRDAARRMIQEALTISDESVRSSPLITTRIE